MARKIDPLNKKLFGPITAMLTVTDIKAAAAFYQKAFGFAKRGIMNGPDGKAIHGELTVRGTTIMLTPEMPQMGSRSAKTIGASPTSLYLLTENVDKTVANAVKLGATPKGPVMDMFWGDRCGVVVDPEGCHSQVGGVTQHDGAVAAHTFDALWQIPHDDKATYQELAFGVRHTITWRSRFE